MSRIRIEAEDMALTTYGTEANSSASGGKLISLLNAAGSIGSASTLFTGEEGSYNIVVGYYDENDGVSELKGNDILNDSDGTGFNPAVLIATLQGVPSLGLSQFTIIA